MESLAFSPLYLAKPQTQQRTVELITPHSIVATVILLNKLNSIS